MGVANMLSSPVACCRKCVESECPEPNEKAGEQNSAVSRWISCCVCRNFLSHPLRQQCNRHSLRDRVKDWLEPSGYSFRGLRGWSAQRMIGKTHRDANSQRHHWDCLSTPKRATCKRLADRSGWELQNNGRTVP